MQLQTVTGAPFDADHIADQILNHAPTWLKLMKPLVVKAIAALAKELPPDLLALLTDVSGGMDDESIALWQSKLTKIVNDKIDIPKVPEFIEQYIFSTVIGLLLNFARGGQALTLSAA